MFVSVNLQTTVHTKYLMYVSMYVCMYAYVLTPYQTSHHQLQ